MRAGALASMLMAAACGPSARADLLPRPGGVAPGDAGHVAAGAPTAAHSDLPAIPSKAAWALVEVSSGRVLGEAHPEILDSPVQPGSLMKVVTLVAAMDAGLVDGKTAMMCPRRVSYGSHVLDCAHPDLHRPMTAVEALAHSCNSFFLTLSRRLSAEQLSAVAVRLGLPPVSGQSDPVLTGLGLGDYRVAPRRWLAALGRLTGSSSRGTQPDEHRLLMLQALRQAVTQGTAVALSPAGSWLAKTGTAPMPGGGVEGLMMAIEPPVTPPASRGPERALVVVAPGASGRDAAAIAAAIVEDRRPARGPRVRLGRATRTGYAVASMPLEDYVADVLAAEAPSDATPATLKALAIVARTFVIRHLDRHQAEGFDVCDLTHCQVLRAATARTRDATRATVGTVLMTGRRLADVYYSASCGGTLATAEEVWSGRRRDAGAPARTDPAGHAANEVNWVAELTAAQVVTVLKGAGLSGDRVEDLVVVDRSPSGRVAQLRASGFSPDLISGEGFRMTAGRLLGWQTVKSTAFDLTRTAAGFRLVGRGHGHGVGLCLRGAVALSTSLSANEILAAYFPSASVAALPESAGDDQVRVRVVLPWGQQSRTEFIRRSVLRLAASVGARLGQAVPGDITLRFHPTVAAYERASGARWWTAGVTRGARIELLPLDVLESRGLLEGTLAHELVHVLTEPLLQERPLWIREGLAFHFEALPASRLSPVTADSCPGDNAFQQAHSAEDLASLYKAAAACVSRELARGTSWRDLGNRL